MSEENFKKCMDLFLVEGGAFSYDNETNMETRKCH
jgi:hypothetical protein